MTKELNIWESLWNGTTKIEGSIFLCQGTYPRHSNYSSMNRLQNYKINPIRTLPILMEQIYNMLRPLTPPPHFQRGVNFFIQVTDTLFFYAREIYRTMLPIISFIASEQNSPAKNTTNLLKQFLDYAASQ